MKFVAYLKDKTVEIILFTASCLLFIAIMIALKTELSAIVCFLVIFGLAGITVITYGFLRKRSFYIEAQKTLTRLDKKYLLSEMIDEPNFWEGKFLYDSLWQTNKSMREQVTKSEKQMLDFRDYIELWVHEIKTPLSSLSLSSPMSTKHIDEINNYIEQALFYSKTGTPTKDYIIKTIQLDEVVKNAIKNNKEALIGNKVKVELSNLDYSVHSDSKWLGFILNQIILNAIKYRRKNPQLSVTSERNDREVSLTIEDNGIGIKKSELKRIFEKGFTGTNGRSLKRSTGMGLYISKKLAEDLGHKIFAESVENSYTRIKIVFGETDYYETLQNR